MADYNYKIGDIVTLTKARFSTAALQNAMYKITEVNDESVRLTPVNPAVSQRMYERVGRRYTYVRQGIILPVIRGGV